MGQFSWRTQDTDIPIFNDWDVHGDRQTIHMVDPRDGHDYKEEGYQGYGVFGGRDFYELLADINKDLILALEENRKPEEQPKTIDAIAINPDKSETPITVVNPVVKRKFDLKELLNKKFEDLTEKDIDNKRLLGIDLWFDYIEVESWRPNHVIQKIPEGMSWKSPILIEDYSKWEKYKDSNNYPESDENQGWHVEEEESDYEEHFFG